MFLLCLDGVYLAMVLNRILIYNFIICSHALFHLDFLIVLINLLF